MIGDGVDSSDGGLRKRVHGAKVYRYAVKDTIQALLDYVPLGVNDEAPIGAYGHNKGAIATGASIKPHNLPNPH